MSEILHIPVDRELSDRVRWLIALRWVVLAVAVTVVLAGNHWLGRVLPTLPLWATFAAVAVYNLGFWVIAVRLVSRSAPYECHAVLMHAQILLDLLAITVVLHYSGGLENPFSLYYVLLVVIGSILMHRKASLLYALTATILWIALMLLEAIGYLPHYNLTGFRLPTRYQQPIHIVAEAFVVGSACFGCAYLVSDIMDRLRHEEEALYQANTACDLRTHELSALNERLQEFDRTRSLFLRLVTHELRAPVAAIQSYLRLIMDGYVPEQRFHEIVSKAERRSRDQLELIGDLLDLARAEDPTRATQAEPVDVMVVLRDVLDLMQARSDDKRIDIRVEAPDSVPLVMATSEHLQQIWTNLVSNAIKYTPEDGHVVIRVEPRGGLVTASVQDTGIGIPDAVQEHIFEPFYRTEEAKAMAAHGTGLGLSIVKRIMDRYGGRIWLESEEGVGTTFTFELPIAA